MKRRLLNLLTALSLLLGAATVAMWVRGHRSRDILMLTWSSGRAILETAPGAVGLTLSLGGDWADEAGVAVEHWPASTEANQAIEDLVHAGPTRYEAWERWGFGSLWATDQWDEKGDGRTWHIYVLPSWFLTLAFAALPVARVVRRRRTTRRRDAGHCPDCGYDLRATPGRCPECGAGVAESC